MSDKGRAEELRIGMFVHLDLPWMDHPFLTSSFRIRTQKQLDLLRRFNLEKVTIDHARSDPAPEGDAADSGAPAAPAGTSSPGDAAGSLEDELWEEKNRRIRILKERRTRLNQCAKSYSESVGLARKMMGHLRSSPAQAVEEADELVTRMVADLAPDHETTVQLVNLKSQDESSYFHAINVMALAVVVGDKLALDTEELHLLGLGSLFHDLGHQKIPSQVLYKRGDWNKPERGLYEQHPIYGVEIGRALRSLPEGVFEIIGKHHEHLDGSGYPNRLRGDAIGLLTRIVTVVNRYDNLCNGSLAKGKALSPHQAVSQMYTQERSWYDPRVLTTFITNLGVYPPGTVVLLEDERIALVISINADDLLKPNVVVYEPEVPNDQALILDLTEESVAIRKSLHRNELSADVVEYLKLTDKLSYYFQPGRGS